MEQINKAKSISIWIFILPFIAVNTCLILITQFHSLFPNQVDIIHSTFPYLDGGTSISRTARPYPSWLIFKPLMIFTSFLLVKYWIYNREIINFFSKDHKNIRKIFFFGVASAIFLTLHSIFLGIKFDNDFYKLFRRIILLAFVIFEIVAQAYLVTTLYSFKKNLLKYVNLGILKTKIVLVSILIVVAVTSIPIVSLPGDKFLGIQLKFLKHGLEWNYFLGIISFYFLTFLMWKKQN
tara:strand:+ start:197 stop:907 length:711 start_codon:yes stop_codon:yes gene_type:complete